MFVVLCCIHFSTMSQEEPTEVAVEENEEATVTKKLKCNFYK